MKEESGQFDNALWITFSGGYGMFVDNFTANEYEVVICHKCAHELCDKVEWIKKLIRPHHSHSHTIDYVNHHEDHYGWDYDIRSGK